MFIYKKKCYNHLLLSKNTSLCLLTEQKKRKAMPNFDYLDFWHQYTLFVLFIAF